MNYLHYHILGSNRLAATVAYRVLANTEEGCEIEFDYTRASPREKSPTKRLGRTIAEGKLLKDDTSYRIFLAKGKKLRHAVAEQIAADRGVSVSQLNYRETSNYELITFPPGYFDTLTIE